MKTGKMKHSLGPNDRSFAEFSDDNPFLVLGETASIGSKQTLHVNANLSGTGIVLVDRIEPAELVAVLDQLSDPTVPIADFGNNRDLRRDFVGRDFVSSSITDLKRLFAPIWQRLADLPFRAAREDRPELTALRLAYR